MKKLMAIILVFSLLFLSACNEGSDNIDRPDVNLSNSDFIDIGDVNLEQQYDNTGAFSYISFRARRNIRPYFKNNDEFPGSIFIYQTNTPHIDDVKLYGYMDSDFQTMTNPISLSPNVFAMGLAKVHADDGDYIINDNFVPVSEVCPGFVLVGNSMIKVSWGEEPPGLITYLPNLDISSYLVPVKVDTGTYNDGGKIYNYGYTYAKAFLDMETNDESMFVIPAVFEDARPFFNGLAAVKRGGLWGYIDESGDTAIDYQYLAARDFTDSSAFVFKGEETIIFKPGPDKNTPVEEIQYRGYWGMIDITGNPLTEFNQITHPGDFHDGLAIVNYDTRPWGYFEIRKEIEIEGYGSINQNYINTKGENMLIKHSRTLLEVFKEGVAVIPVTGAYYFCDSDFNKLFNNTYSNARNFSDGLAVVRAGRNSYKYIDMLGKTAIEGSYIVANDFNNGYAFVINKMGEPGYIIDKLGNTYLKNLNILGMSKFNDEGYAIAYTVIDIDEETQDKLYYMIHIENLPE